MDSPIPQPNTDQVLIKVIISGTNPKDWKQPDFMESHITQETILPVSLRKSETTLRNSRLSIRGRQNHTEGKAGIKTGAYEFAYVFFRHFTRGLQLGWFASHPYQVIPGGLKRVEEGLTNLKAGKASAVKYVYKIEDTK